MYILHGNGGRQTHRKKSWSYHMIDVIKWKHFPHYWPFVRRIHRWPVNSPHKGQWRGALMFSWICAWINGWVNNRDAGDLRRHRAHYDVIVIIESGLSHWTNDDLAGIILWMRSTNARRRYTVTSSLIGWAHSQKDPWLRVNHTTGTHFNIHFIRNSDIFFRVH